MKNREAPLTRFLFIAALALALAAMVFLALRRRAAVGDLKAYVKEQESANTSLSLIDSSLEKFQHLQSAFRVYSIKKDTASKVVYLRSLEAFSSSLTATEKQLAGDGRFNHRVNFNSLFRKEQGRWVIFLKLKILNDSLIKQAVLLNEVALPASYTGRPISLKQARVFVKKTDTLVTIPVKGEEKGLVKRLAEAIANKEDLQKAKTETSTTVELYTAQEKRVQKELNSLLSRSLRQLERNQDRLASAELNMLLSNDELLKQIYDVLKAVKAQQTEIIVAQKGKINAETAKAVYQLDNYSWSLVLTGMVLVFILLLSIGKQFLVEKSLKKANSELQKQVKIRKDFLAHMSHEVRTPLNAIFGISEQLQSSELTGKQKEQLQAIKESSQMLLAVVDDILDLSKLDSQTLNLRKEVFAPEHAIGTVVSTLKVLADNRNLKLAFHCHFHPFSQVRGDDFRLKQVLINLINNAVKFTKEGTVTVNAELVNGRNLKVSVSDTGRGIPEKDIPGIFDEFSQAANTTGGGARNGVGLGLAICKKIIEGQKGAIHVKSELGKGSVFTFEIPYEQAEPLSGEKKEGGTYAADYHLLKEKRFLIAEDNKMNIMLLEIIFNKWGIKYDLVDNGLKAFDLHQQNNYDMILTDIHMPELDGVKLAERVRALPNKQKSSVPILAITGNLLLDQVDFHTRTKINGLISKPFKEEDLFKKVSEFL